MYLRRVLLLAAALAAVAPAQVHYHDSGQPWRQRARRGPDAEVPGWYYNLGVTGIRAELVKDRPKWLLVRHVFEGSPGHGRVKVGDYVVGAGGRRFKEDHQNGYGMKVFGARGPISELAAALELAMTRKKRGKLQLELLRDEKVRQVTLDVGTKYGAYSQTYPVNCKKSDRILKELYAWLADHQRNDGSWGSVPQNTFAPLALLASGKPAYLKHVKKNVKQHARSTHAVDKGGLINWRYMAAAIVMGEYYLATREKWVLPELQEVYDFIVKSQYTDVSQINPKSRKSHPDAQPRGALDKHGGWGHNPGFEGYGPISMITGQGALAMALMKHCGIDVDRRLHDSAYEFLARGTGRNGYVWYADGASRHRDWADMGRTGASGVANFLSPWQGKRYRERALAHARVIGEHPESFPDTHGSPIMGMGYTALAAHVEKRSFRSLMDANRWWFVMARCHDGTFYYQPNRDNAGYGGDSRMSATAVTAFVLSIPKGTLHVTGKPMRKRKR